MQKITFMMKTKWLKPVTISALVSAFICFVAMNTALFAKDSAEVSGEPSAIEYEFVDDTIESVLHCDFFSQCLHIKVINPAQCPESILIEMGFLDLQDRPMSDEDIVVPSAKYNGSFVIEIGSNATAEIGTLGVTHVSCSVSAPNLIGVT